MPMISSLSMGGLMDTCRFLDAECNIVPEPELSIDLNLKYCQNCLMGKLISELKLLRVTGIQP